MAVHKANILINAPAELVFAALTQPGLVQRWQFGKTVTSSWKTGSAIRFSVLFEGKKLEQWGTVLELRPNALIKYNLFTPAPGLEDKTENYCVTTYTLTEAGQQTHVELVQEDNRASSFAPASLLPILTALKKVAEDARDTF